MEPDAATGYVNTVVLDTVIVAEILNSDPAELTPDTVTVSPVVYPWANNAVNVAVVEDRVRVEARTAPVPRHPFRAFRQAPIFPHRVNIPPVLCS
jgi:hypothetical protein